MENQQPTQEIKVKPEQLDNVWCSNKDCVCAVFEVIYVLKKIPVTISPSGKAYIQPIQIYKCKDCGSLDQEINPPGAIAGESY